MGTSLPYRSESFAFANSTQNYSARDISKYYHVFVMAVITGSSLAGTAKLQISNDGTNWIDVGSSSQALPASGGSLIWDVATAAGHMRVVGISSDADIVTMAVTYNCKE